MQKRELQDITNLARKALATSKKYQHYANDEYLTHTRFLQSQLKKGASLDDILVDGFGLAISAINSVLGMTPYLVQVIGGIVLHQGKIAEMKTGEGKTLTASLPLYLNALTGKGVHLITVNNYLAKRDKTELEPVYNTLGLTVGFNDDTLDLVSKQKAYQADILYTTNSAVGFDYLNDNLALNVNQQRQRGLNYAIIDEVDSILIDESTTPLVIAGRKVNNNDNVARQKAEEFVRYLPNNEVIIEREKHNVRMRPSAVLDALSTFGKDLFTNQPKMVHFITNSLQAKFLFIKNVDYIKTVKDHVHVIALVNSNTGRVLTGQRFSEGIQEALEIKENVLINSETQTSATITYQSLLQKYNKVAGMTGTAYSDKGEFNAIYDLNIVRVPTNKPNQRVDLPLRIFPTKDDKFKAIANEILKYHDRHQPVLVGTNSIKSSQILSRLLDNYGIAHYTLNATNAEYESRIIAKAGEKNAITIATNMAGRGTDIKISKEVEQLGGLVVLGTEHSNSKRIDNQLKGRTARQGQKGITQMYASLEDDILDKVKMPLVKFYQRKYSQNISVVDYIDINNEIIEQEKVRVYTKDLKDISDEFYINYNQHASSITFKVKNPIQFLKTYMDQTVYIQIKGHYRDNHEEIAVNSFRYNYLEDESKLKTITIDVNNLQKEPKLTSHNVQIHLSQPLNFSYVIAWQLPHRKLKRMKTGEIHSPLVTKMFQQVQQELSKQGFESRKSDLGFENVIATERDLIYAQRQHILDGSLDLYELIRNTTLLILSRYWQDYKPQQKVNLTLLKKVKKDLIEKEFSNQIVPLPLEPHRYPNVKYLAGYVQNLVLAELSTRQQLLGNSFDEVVRPIILNTIDYFFAKELSFLQDLKSMIGFESNRQANPYVVFQQKASESYQDMLQHIQNVFVQLFFQFTISK